MERRVVIDTDECTACGTCVEICPEVFSMEEDAEAAEVIKDTGGPEDTVQEAMDTCPVQCITWEG